ncbi:uncharacterized protein [Euphorbia lathyris]|uniref:uncharacterized protein isoform X1 n=1 Tax=Euphorbia lathyris TaxID=212925 RepID=UPI0033133CE0
MPGSQIAIAVEINPSLLAFKPRQVVLLSKPPIMNLDDANSDLKTLVQQKTLLFNSIVRYLQRSGFSKTVKKFLSEAKIQKDDLGDSSFDLEEIFCNFVDTCSKVSKSHKVKDGGVAATHAIELPGDGKKKKSDKASKSKNVGEVIDDAIPVDVKSKENKKTKNDTYASDQEQVIPNVLVETDQGTNNESKEEKKKKKKSKKSSNPVIDEGKLNKSDSKGDEFQSPEEDETEKENKSSKKRKRVAAEEVAVQPASEKVVEESKPKKKDKSKRRKTEVSDELKVEGESQEAEKEESNQACPGESQKTCAEQVNGLSNGSLEENGEKSATEKTIKKEKNASAEPKAVKHFQRVKVEEVVFSDERLKNNSYWAKDGADSGYGAKAQEILEQVRGRDFRHEKTKKKRGSYRGGQIDLQSHSVKFNYSDEE